MNLAEAKARLNIHDLWRHFGFEGEPSKSCRCPFHKDKSESFSVFAGRARWNCFAGCGKGDAVDFYMRASGLAQGDACRTFIALAGGTPAPVFTSTPQPQLVDADAASASKRATWPAMESPLTSEDGISALAMGELATLRHVSLGGAELMAKRGLLWFAMWKQHPAWIVADSARVNAQARRMNGQQWEGINAKAQTLPGSRAAWPVGVNESKPFPVILLCEGGPDLLAAHHYIAAHKREADTAAVAMLGANSLITADALPLFAGKRVRITAHADDAGRNAAVRWADQLKAAGCVVDALDFSGLLMADGSPVKDLNDCTRIAPEQANELKTLIPTE